MTSRRLEARIERDFGEAAAAEVLGRLSTLRLPLAENQSEERIQAAVVLLARGDPERFATYAAVAERDWRDVLVYSGLGNADWPERLDAELGVPD